MDDVADTVHPPTGPSGPSGRSAPGEEPTPPRGELIVPPPVPPPMAPSPASSPAPPPAPAPLDPEQVRQFQQFQQFQELMRQQAEQGFPPGQPPPPNFLQPWGPPPPKRGPLQRVAKAVAARLATAVIVALLLVGAGFLAIDYFFGNPPVQPPASQIGGGKQKTTLLFEENPRAAVQRIYDDIAQGDPENACGRFDDSARAEFTDHFGSFGADCEEIVTALNAQVVPGQKDEYANPSRMTTVSRAPAGDSVTVSSCALGVRGGPELGRLTVTRDRSSQGGNQWIVTGHDEEICTAEPSAPPTS